MNLKELAELKELIAEREKLELDFQAAAVKLDARIAAKVAKLQTVTAAKPVEVEGYTRDLPQARKTRSDKGKSRKVGPETIAQEFMQGEDQGIEPEAQKAIDGTMAALDARG